MADTIDLSSPLDACARAIDLSRPEQADGAGPSTFERPADTVEAELQHAAAESESEAEGRSTGKCKRSWATDRAKQAEAKKKQLKAQKAEASARKAEAKAAQKAAEQKRVDQFGKIVRYAAKPSEKTKERMARAMPSKCAYLLGRDSGLQAQLLLSSLCKSYPVSVQTLVIAFFCWTVTWCPP